MLVNEPTFREAVAQGGQILERFKGMQPRTWGAEGAYIELTKQVGDLAKHIMVTDGYYGQRQNTDRYASSKAHIEDELVDIFTAVVRLARHYEIDLVAATARVRQAEDEFLRQRGL
jgi:NTP pyrophosphatase (non-canonical NTP hydrolase)